MPRRDLLDDPSRHRFVGNFSSGPLADGTCFGLLAGQRDQLAGLFGADLAPPAGARGITESIRHRQVSQRVRQARTVSTLRPRWRAIWLLFLPALASKMMRPLSATCWALPCRRTIRSNSFRSISLKLNGSGFGPRITGFASFLSLLKPSILQNYFRLNVLAVIDICYTFK